MNKTFSFFFFTSLILVFFSCKENTKETVDKEVIQTPTKVNIFNNASSVALYEMDSVWEYQTLLNDAKRTIEIPKSKLPFKEMAVLSSSSIGYIEALDELDAIKGVFDPQWIYSPALHQRIEQNPALDQGSLAALNLEKIIALAPDVVIAFSAPNMTKIYQRLEEAGVLIIYVDEYNENTPLGKSEFLKLFGVLSNKLPEAEALYEEIESNYITLRQKAIQDKNKPKVLANIMRGDIWYLPGGESYAAQYFKDAGADYLWSENENVGNIKKNFEQVFEKAGDADYWMNVSDFSSLKQLDDAYINHHWFKAFKEGNVYAFSKKMNADGASEYFEKGSVRVDWVLKDLVRIFHPELLPEHSLYFYQKLK